MTSSTEQRRAADARYNASEKGRGRHRKYNRSEKGRQRYWTYNISAKGYYRNWRYEYSSHGMRTRLTGRIAQREAQLAVLEAQLTELLGAETASSLIRS